MNAEVRETSMTSDNVALSILSNALNYCKEKTGKSNVVELLRCKDSTAIGYFHYGLARDVASFLGGVDDLVSEAFLHPDPWDETQLGCLPLTLIVRAERRTAALESLVEGLERELLEEYRKVFTPEADRCVACLNISLVDDDEVCRRHGLAAAIRALHTPAMPVWRRR